MSDQQPPQTNSVGPRFAFTCGACGKYLNVGSREEGHTFWYCYHCLPYIPQATGWKRIQFLANFIKTMREHNQPAAAAYGIGHLKTDENEFP
jgi:hypothetical protein